MTRISRSSSLGNRPAPPLRTGFGHGIYAKGIRLIHRARKIIARAGSGLKLSRLRFGAAQGGNVAITFSIAAPALLLVSGAALDYSQMFLRKSNLQAAVDAAAIAAGRELRLANTNKGHILAVARNTVAANLNTGAGKTTVSAKIVHSPSRVIVTAGQTVGMILMGNFVDGRISARAVAEVMGGSPICMLGLGENRLLPSIQLEQSARITGKKCSIYSNALGPRGLTSYGRARMEADFICSSGGYSGSLANYSPRPLTDCPTVPDPLAGRAAPPVGPCTYTNTRIDVYGLEQTNSATFYGGVTVEGVDDQTAPLGVSASQAGKVRRLVKNHSPREVTLKPGVYCGGLKIGGAVKATLQPGVYVIKDGPLYIGDEASIRGDHVGFYFTGSEANLYFGPETSINLTAPASGPMAGLLFFEDRNRAKMSPFAILSDDARVLEGTIYLPRSNLYIDADAPIADKSAYTAIVAQRIDLFKGPNLVLNANYDLTDVPVPEGIARNGKIILRE